MNGKYKAFEINDERHIEAVDQTKLPFIEERVVLKTSDDVITAIKDMLVRGAGVIGNIGAFGVYFAVRENSNFQDIINKANEIRKSRPTAVNLMWAVDTMIETLSEKNIKNHNDLLEAAYTQAVKICDDDCRKCRKIAEYGCDALEEIMKAKGKTSINVLTHCNAGWLGIVDEGSALAPVYEAQRRGIESHL